MDLNSGVKQDVIGGSGERRVISLKTILRNAGPHLEPDAKPPGRQTHISQSEEDFASVGCAMSKGVAITHVATAAEISFNFIEFTPVIR